MTLHTPAFVTSFTGVSLNRNANFALSSRSHVTATSAPRCVMAGDAKAPVISITRKDYEPANSVSVQFEQIAASYAEADAVASNSALAAVLRKSQAYASLPAATSSSSSSSAHGPAPGTSVADFYYPEGIRNQAPFVSLGADMSLSVTYAPVEAEVAGVSSTSPAPFWEQQSYKWTASSPTTATSATGTQAETLDTAEYERYFPSDIRNRAPYIKITAPIPGGFKNPSLEVGSEFVAFNPILSRLLELPNDPKNLAPPLNAAATIATFYPDSRLNKAPVLTVDPDAMSISCAMQDITVSEEAAAAVAKDAS